MSAQIPGQLGLRSASRALQVSQCSLCPRTFSRTTGGKGQGMNSLGGSLQAEEMERIKVPASCCTEGKFWEDFCTLLGGLDALRLHCLPQ